MTQQGATFYAKDNVASAFLGNAVAISSRRSARHRRCSGDHGLRNRGRGDRLCVFARFGQRDQRGKFLRHLESYAFSYQATATGGTSSLHLCGHRGLAARRHSP